MHGQSLMIYTGSTYLMIARWSSVRWATSSSQIFLRLLTRCVARSSAYSRRPISHNLQDQDGALKAEELDELFSTSPGNPWAGQKFPDTTVADDTGAVTLQGWLAQWRCVWLLEATRQTEALNSTIV